MEIVNIIGPAVENIDLSGHGVGNLGFTQIISQTTGVIQARESLTIQTYVVERLAQFRPRRLRKNEFVFS